MSPPRKRADVLLVERGLFESRARAQAAIEAGLVTANDKQVLKPSETIPADAELQAQPAHPFVSRGGVKLAGALERYPIEIEDHVCLDVGASTGGFTEVLLANGASLVFSIDVGREPVASLAARPSQDRLDGGDRHPRLRGQAAAAAAGYRRDRCQLHLAESGAAGGAVAGGSADAPAGADQAAIRGGAKTFQARHHPRRRQCIGKSATTSRPLPPRLAAAISRCFRPRSRAATATSNSSSARAVAERLVIDHVGHRGDGVASPAARACSCRTRWAAKRSRSNGVHGHPDRRRLMRVEHAKPGAHRAVLPIFRCLRRLRDPALADGSATGPGNAPSWSRRWRRPASPARSRLWSMPMAPAGAASRSMLAAEWHGELLKVGFAAASSPRHRPDRRIARSSIPACSGALDAAWALAEPLKPGRQAARYPGHRRQATASTSTCAAPGR